jgi:hypothetical protein
LSVEFSSASAPLRRTTTCIGCPDPANTADIPRVIAIDVTSTATVRPMPNAVINVVALRSTRLRRL